MRVDRYDITPVPAPRQVRSDAWAPRPGVQRYRAFRDEVRLRRIDLPAEGARVIFVLPMPKSWPKDRKAEMDGAPHEGKPDKDNLIKALADSVHGEDAHLWHDDGTVKFWGQRGEIIIISREVPDDERTLAGYLRAAGADES